MLRSHCLTIGAALALALGGMARAAPPSHDVGPAVDLPLELDSPPATLTEAPNNDDLASEYPHIPLLMGMSGSARMSCKTLPTGQLEDCHVDSEEPAGLGFGAATVRSARFFRVQPAMRDGKAVEGTITIPLRWQPVGLMSTPEPMVLVPASPASLALARRVLELQNIAAQMQTAWEPSLERENAQLMMGSGGGGAGQALLEAFRQGLADTVQAEVERQAHEIAANESEADLRATVAFLESPSGRAWTTAQAQSQASAPKDLYQRIAFAARTHFCLKGPCLAKATASAGR